MTGQSLVVAVERLYEDPDNPRTEFPELGSTNWPGRSDSTASFSRSSCIPPTHRAAIATSGRSDDGDSNATIGKRLGMDLTTVAHHLALLDLPAELDQALQTGRCTSPRTLYDLSRLHTEQPAQAHAMLSGEGEITRCAVAALRVASMPSGAPSAAVAKLSTSLIEQANATYLRLEALVVRVKKSRHVDAQIELTALRHRIADLANRLG